MKINPVLAAAVGSLILLSGCDLPSKWNSPIL
jgi:hypothetical protein